MTFGIKKRVGILEIYGLYLIRGLQETELFLYLDEIMSTRARSSSTEKNSTN